VVVPDLRKGAVTQGSLGTLFDPGDQVVGLRVIGNLYSGHAEQSREQIDVFDQTRNAQTPRRPKPPGWDKH
jgi:hypothetical protein